MVKRGEALNDGLPRDNVVQDDQILCGVGQMSLDPLRRERVLKCLCYHGMDLCLGCRETPFRHYPTDQRSQKHALGEKISGYYLSISACLISSSGGSKHSASVCHPVSSACSSGMDTLRSMNRAVNSSANLINL